ncbi:MAG: hypothetical protein COX79_00805 [Candidatus Levybacteria bacterium CG_4_10_14_0_2_um_filter_36_16]|nr:MAG: hypothetical protein AUK12_01445 [Candidatus Levybacteria bacterium CG2_30_37_29]PIZ97823.1 MAG: hypothetical protein COX79_00805 [Candidatus Levybacteria bacterium CG_4_10_14_0_2_um_filter_36_16]PJA90503.1 MAG: hypothetical protein CO136_01950 [Candidatus Levybacteria bacterium CG_4_9_14_3_um_filter_36_7]
MLIDIVNFLNHNSGVIQAITTIVLTTITFFYMLYTKRTVKELALQREYGILPILIIEDVDVKKIKNLKKTIIIPIKINNVGNGPAFQVDAHLSVSEQPTINSFKQSFIGKGEVKYINFVFKKEHTKDIFKPTREIKLINVSIDFHSAYHKCHGTIQSFHLSKEGDLHKLTGGEDGGINLFHKEE